MKVVVREKKFEDFMLNFFYSTLYNNVEKGKRINRKDVHRIFSQSIRPNKEMSKMILRGLEESGFIDNKKYRIVLKK